MLFIRYFFLLFIFMNTANILAMNRDWQQEMRQHHIDNRAKQQIAQTAPSQQIHVNPQASRHVKAAADLHNVRTRCRNK